VLPKLLHERKAKLADLVVRLAFGVEICSSFATSNVYYLNTGQFKLWMDMGSFSSCWICNWCELTAGQGILENLFEAQELKNRQVHRGMEPQPTLVWPQCRVELHTVSAIDLDSTLVIFPGDSELDDPFGDRGNFESGLVFRILLEE